ncbi:elements of external origin [Herbaspirillum aquaticum]|uniref:elements of external origin n=1 Tax=Herbaspirillum aquaticum TaxID=568783 RepID=UPI0024DECB43|nr:elements of external origin [Herbaspirillum aquaticum]
MGLSIRAYARHRGVSHVAVKKAIDTGRISQLPDGTIDPVVADAQWAANTTPTRRSVTAEVRETPQASAKVLRDAPEPPTPALSSGGTSLLQARTVNEVVKAQTNKVRLARLKGELVDRSQAVAHVFKLARAERDAWLNWPARISSQMAAGLGVDAHVLHVALDTAVRQQLQDLGDLQPKVD